MSTHFPKIWCVCLSWEVASCIICWKTACASYEHYKSYSKVTSKYITQKRPWNRFLNEYGEVNLFFYQINTKKIFLKDIFHSPDLSCGLLRSFCYLFCRPLRDEKLSWIWSHQRVLNPETLDWCWRCRSLLSDPTNFIANYRTDDREKEEPLKRIG